MRGCRGGAGEFLALRIGLPCFPTGFESDVSRAEADADFLQERVRRCASSKDPDKIVGHVLLSAGNVESDRLRLELYWIRIEQHPHLSRLGIIFDALGVTFLDAAEALAAV